MKIKSYGRTLAVAGLFVGAGVAIADEAGQSEYLGACASCHGTAALGNGPMAEFMTLKVPDLTMLKANNDGVFPMREVIHMIDGRTGVRGHGTEMPIWGNRYKEDSVQEAGVFGAEVIVRGRVLSLAYYLESIQK